MKHVLSSVVGGLCGGVIAWLTGSSLISAAEGAVFGAAFGYIVSGKIREWRNQKRQMG